jgi:hypothetical protein
VTLESPFRGIAEALPTPMIGAPARTGATSSAVFDAHRDEERSHDFKALLDFPLLSTLPSDVRDCREGR